MAVSKVVFKSSPTATPVTWIDATTATAAASDIASSKSAMLANGVVTTGTGTGGGSVTVVDTQDSHGGIVKTITSSVSSHVVLGTFTASSSEKGTAKNISIPYSGSGYPISLVIYPSVGVYKSGSDIYSLVQQYVIVSYNRVKSDISSTPTYDDGSLANNRGSFVGLYKSSSSDSTSVSNNGGANGTMFLNSNAAEGFSTSVRFKSATTLSVFIANTSYGFADGIEYTYQIIYSS